VLCVLTQFESLSICFFDASIYRSSLVFHLLLTRLHVLFPKPNLSLPHFNLQSLELSGLSELGLFELQECYWYRVCILSLSFSYRFCN
jgi:hypothetical protein